VLAGCAFFKTTHLAIPKDGFIQTASATWWDMGSGVLTVLWSSIIAGFVLQEINK